MRTPFLTICIPSYNRGVRVKALVTYLLAFVDAHCGAIELLVSNNASKDGTEQLLAGISSPHFRLHNREKHVPTAEENIFESMDLCRGKFVWCLGDDDIPHLAAVKSMVELLRLDQYDFFFFNSQYADEFGAPTGASFVRMNADVVGIEFPKGGCAAGLISNLSGISNVVFRRETVMRVDWREIKALTPIYAHTAWWVIAFHDARMAIVNRMLVRYRVEDTARQLAHYTDVAAGHDVGDYFFWSVGTIRLLMLLENRGALSADHIRSIWEFRRDGSTFRLLDNAVTMLFWQVRAGVSTKLTRNILDSETVRECADWILRMDPGYLECVQVIYHALDAAGLPSKAETDVRLAEATHDFDLLINHKMARDNRYLNLIGGYREFDLYEHWNGIVAFARTSGVDRQEVLRWIDPKPVKGEVIVGSNIDDVQRRIDQEANRPESPFAGAETILKQIALDAHFVNVNSAYLCTLTGHIKDLAQQPAANNAPVSQAPSRSSWRFFLRQRS